MTDLYSHPSKMFYSIGDEVHLLKKDDFNKQGKLVSPNLTSGYTSIILYADWCGYCVSTKPIYAKVSKMICCQNHCAGVDCTNSRDILNFLKSVLNEGFHFSGFPTIIQFRNGVFLRQYEGERTFDKLLKFAIGDENY